MLIVTNLDLLPVYEVENLFYEIKNMAKESQPDKYGVYALDFKDCVSLRISDSSFTGGERYYSLSITQNCTYWYRQFTKYEDGGEPIDMDFQEWINFVCPILEKHRLKKKVSEL